MSQPDTRRIVAFLAAGVAFVVLATANGAGYRYGVSDQAFYVPAVQRALNPALFPRDGALMDAEGGLMVIDELLAFTVRTTGVSLEMLFLGAYLTSLALLWTAVVLIGTRLSASPWVLAIFGGIVTLRHRIPRTSANSLEPYFHPRVLAFAFGTLAMAAVLRRRHWAAVALVAVAALVHVTTALWFAVLLGVAIPVADPRWRLPAIAAGIGAACVLTLMVTSGPLRDALVVMDPMWLQAVASKDSLFPSQWPAWAWIANLASLPVLLWMYRLRASRGVATSEDRGLLCGAATLVGLFLVTLPFVTAGVSLAVQFQISRVFWIVEFVAAAYVAAALAGPLAPAFSASRNPPTASLNSPSPAARRLHPAAACAVAIVTLAAARGTYVMLVERPERSLFETRLPATSWEDAMGWLARQPEGVHVLADPGHAWKYGTSVRVAAARDVLVEDVKDSAVAIYSRDVALRVVERTAAIGDFTTLTPDHARHLAQAYGLDYLVTEADLDLPMTYRNDRFRIYSLR